MFKATNPNDYLTMRGNRDPESRVYHTKEMRSDNSHHVCSLCQDESQRWGPPDSLEGADIYIKPDHMMQERTDSLVFSFGLHTHAVVCVQHTHSNTKQKCNREGND